MTSPKRNSLIASTPRSPRSSRALAVALTLCAALVGVSSSAFAQEGVGGGSAAEETTVEAAPSKVLPGTVETATVTIREQPVTEERIVIPVPAGDPAVVYTFTNLGGTIRSATLQHERFVREAKDAMPGVPDEKVAEGPIDLVSTWSAKYLPYRMLFTKFDYPGVTSRTVREATGQTITAGKLTIAKDRAGITRDDRVAAGDVLTISAPEALAGKYSVKSTGFGGAITTEPAIEGDHTDVSYTVSRQGDIGKLFVDDPTFVRVSDAPGLPLTYVWPDPAAGDSPIYIEKRYDVGSHDYELNLTVTIHNVGSNVLKAQPGLTIGGWQHPSSGQASLFSRPTDIVATSCYTNESLERNDFTALKDDEPPMEVFTTPTEWVSVDTTYFMTAAAPVSRNASGQCKQEVRIFDRNIPGAWVSQATYLSSSVLQLNPGQNGCVPSWKGGERSCESAYTALGVDGSASRKQVASAWTAARATDEVAADAAYDSLKNRRRAIYRFKLFNGPKDVNYLELTTPSMKESLDQGIFSFISAPLHRAMIWLHGIFGSWPLAIIVLTLIVKLLLLPLTNKSYKSMQKMAKLKPQIEEIKKRFPDDRQRQSQEQMALMKREKVNPLGGCLPMLIQMPIWFGLYQMIFSSVEFYHEPMLWIPDLSAPDPLFILPVVLGLLMFAQTMLTTSMGTMDGLQGKIMKFGMPIMFAAFMLFLPSALVLYILVSTVLTVIQNVVIRKNMDPAPKAAAAQPSKA